MKLNAMQREISQKAHAIFTESGGVVDLHWRERGCVLWWDL